jgi:DNA segregation ATPase FtsK/SpoIIIE, S-DNA-T family
VATTQRSRSRSKGGSTGRRKAAAPSLGPLDRLGASFRRALDGHAADVAGLLLIGVGLVTGLGVHLDAAGPAGRLLADAVGAAVGWGRVVTPAAMVLAGVLLVRAPERDDEDDSADAGVPGRPHVWVGGGLVVLAGCGLLHLAGGAPGAAAPTSELARAGGLIGVAVGGPLAAAIATAGAALLLVAVLLAGLVVLTRTPVRVAADRTAAATRPAGSALLAGIRSLFTLRSGEDADIDLDAGGLVYDYEQDVDDDAVADPAPPRKRKRGPKVEMPEVEPDAPVEQLEIELGPGAKGSPWKLPPASLLHRASSQEVDKAAVEASGRVLEQALAQHGVETRLVGMVVGPSVTRFELELGPGVKVSRVTSLHKDIAYAMASPDVRILAPIPGRQAIGVEVPNVDRQIVALGDILASPEAKRATHPLEVAVGRDINGRAVLMNLATMPHLLIAGATGAGKSSCLNSILTSILMRSTPDQVRMILVDPKRVEMGQYDRLPHLLTQVVTNPKKAANALSWAVREMERRYDLLAEVGFRDITGYNAAFDRGELVPAPGSDRELPRLPFILVVIDELADLMMVAARDVEESIARIAQMARAVGIHLVIATQRPSVNVITGVIKANVPARLAFAVSSATDSRVILDQMGAERLIGKGDMLLLGPTSSAPTRIQGSWVEEAEVRKIAAVWKRQAPELTFDDSVQGSDDGPSGSSSGAGGSGGDDDDDLLVQATELVVRSQLGSTSMLQRKLKVGFARAGRIMDLLEQRGVVGPSEGSKARAVLMTVEELENSLEQGEL